MNSFYKLYFSKQELQLAIGSNFCTFCPPRDINEWTPYNVQTPGHLVLLLIERILCLNVILFRNSWRYKLSLSQDLSYNTDSVVWENPIYCEIF